VAEARVLAEGLYFGEGPRWRDGWLYFSDFYDHAVKRVDLEGRVEVVVEVPNQPSGLGWLPDGRMLVVSMRDRKLLRQEPDGKLVEHADLSGIATFHCNDMVVDRHGRAYVGNFGFDLFTFLHEHGVEEALAEPGPPKAKLARVDPDGTVSVAAEDLKFPNGTVITPDGHTMIIAETLGVRLTAFDIDSDGTLHNRRVWADLGAHAPDGICLDVDGNVWVANPLEPVCFLVAEGGGIVDEIETDQPCFACMLGGPHRRDLFMMTAQTSDEAVASTNRTGHVLVATVQAPGAGWP
jgi:sugar lactone lactonase YvrE